jgi:hypothetical protein
MTQHILVPFDGSALAEAVVPHAAALARAHNAELTLFQVIAPSELRQTAGWGPVPAPIRARWVETASPLSSLVWMQSPRACRRSGLLRGPRCWPRATWRRRSSRALNAIHTRA